MKIRPDHPERRDRRRADFVLCDERIGGEILMLIDEPFDVEPLGEATVFDFVQPRSDQSRPDRQMSDVPRRPD